MRGSKHVGQDELKRSKQRSPLVSVIGVFLRNGVLAAWGRVVALLCLDLLKKILYRFIFLRVKTTYAFNTTVLAAWGEVIAFLLCNFDLQEVRGKQGLRAFTSVYNGSSVKPGTLAAQLFFINTAGKAAENKSANT